MIKNHICYKYISKIKRITTNKWKNHLLIVYTIENKKYKQYIFKFSDIKPHLDIIHKQNLKQIMECKNG